MKWILTALLLASFVALNASAGVKVIYDDDNRVEVKEFWDLNALGFHRDMYRSVAAMMEESQIEYPLGYTGTHIKVVAQTLGQAYGLCPGERFANQIVASSCTGFLIDKNVLVTAGHCVEDQQDCERKVWVFDYRVENTYKGAVWVPRSSMFRCKKLWKHRLDDNNMNDYAIIELDRGARDREPLRIRREGRVANDANLVVVGHPSGLPTKIAPRAKVRRNNDPIFFTTNLDTFGGNSGSPVFDLRTGVVEGILVRGENDYVRDSRRPCMRVNNCKGDECMGEDVTRITNIFKSF